jgi:hypothetical protein
MQPSSPRILVVVEGTNDNRKRLRDKAKKWLNTRAVEQMTVARLAERDSSGEIRSWLATIAKLSER